MLETEQGRALRKRESRVSERYKGGRRSQIEKGPIQMHFSQGVSPGFHVGSSTAGTEETTFPTSEKKFVGENPLEDQQSAGIDLERRKTEPKEYMSSHVSRGDVLSNENRMAEFLRGSNQTSKLDEFEAQLAEESEDYSDDEADIIMKEADAKVLARVTELESRQREVQKAKSAELSLSTSESLSAKEREEDESSSQATQKSHRSLDSLGKSVGTTRSRKKTGSSLGSLKNRVSKYVPSTPKGRYRNRRSFEEKSEAIATSNDQLKYKHLLESRYYFSKNPLDL